MVRNIGHMVSLPKKSCEDELCPFHGSLPVRGRLYIGTVESNKSSKMIVVSREYNRLVKKYKRYDKILNKINKVLYKNITDMENNEKRLKDIIFLWDNL